MGGGRSWAAPCGANWGRLEFRLRAGAPGSDSDERRCEDTELEGRDTVRVGTRRRRHPSKPRRGCRRCPNPSPRVVKSCGGGGAADSAATPRVFPPGARRMCCGPLYAPGGLKCRPSQQDAAKASATPEWRSRLARQLMAARMRHTHSRRAWANMLAKDCRLDDATARCPIRSKSPSPTWRGAALACMAQGRVGGGVRTHQPQ